MSGIRDLVESYYNDVYIEEEVLDEQGRRTGSNPNVYTPSGRRGARRGAAGSAKPQIGSLPPNARQVTQYPDGVPTGVGGGNAVASTAASRPAAAPVVRPLPAGAPDLKLKVTSPAGAPSAAPAAKPAGSAMDQWRAANPKLAAAADERDRTRGTSATTNPLMKKTFGADYVSKMPAPKTPSPTTSSTAFSSSTPALGSSTPAMQSAGAEAASKPVTNQTKTAFSNPSLLSQTTAAEKPDKKKNGN